MSTMSELDRIFREEQQIEELMAYDAYLEQQAMQEGMSEPEGNDFVSPSSLPPQDCPF